MWRLVAAMCLAVACRPSPKFAGLDTAPRRDVLKDRLFTTELANGIKVAILPDYRSNLVTVDVRYEIGSADDPAGRSGMAHLAEHVMWETAFAAGKNDLREAALESNASTSLDRTLFWEVALDVELDRVLEIEARRMEAGCGVIDEAIVARERDVVIEEVKTRSLWAARELDAVIWGRHPYARPTAGVEIKEATAAELCRFVEDHYVPANATLVVTGKIDGKLLDRIRARFERIPARRPAARTPVPERFEPETLERELEGLEHPTALLVLPAPPAGSLDEIAGVLVARLLSIKMSMIPRSWVRQVGDERARAIVVGVEVEQAKDLDRVTRGLGKLLAEFGQWGIDRGRLQLRDDLALSFDDVYDRGERIGSAVARGGFSRFRPLDLVDHLERSQIERWMDASRARIVKLVPRGTDRHQRLRALVGSLHDIPVHRDAVPQTTIELPTRRVDRPTDRYTLPNGLHVVLAHDPDSVAVDIRLVLPVGTDSDGPQPGRATIAAYLLKQRYAGYEGTRALDLVRWYDQRVGTRVIPDVRANATTFSISGLGLYSDWLLWNLAWTVVDGKYELPYNLGDHAASPRRAPPPTVLGLIEERLSGHTVREDYSRFDARGLEQFRRSAYRPDTAQLIVSGRFDPATIRRHIELRFGSWRETSIPLPRTPPVVRMPRVPSQIAIEDPDALLVEVGIAFAPSRTDRELSTRAARAVVSEMLGDRLRLIRESLGVSYGFNAAYVKAILLFGSIEPAYADDAAASIKTELARIAAGTGLAEDFARARRRLLARSLAQPVGPVSRARELETAFLHGDVDLAEALRALTLADVVALASGDLRDSRMVVVVRGPRSATDPVFRALGIAPANVERVQLPKP